VNVHCIGKCHPQRHCWFCGIEIRRIHCKKHIGDKNTWYAKVRQKLTVYVDESDKYKGKPVYEILMDIFYKQKISGASVFRGVAGYGSDGVFHTSKMLELSTSLPVKIEVVDSEEMITRILPLIDDIIGKGLIEVSDTELSSAVKELHNRNSLQTFSPSINQALYEDKQSSCSTFIKS